MLRHGRTELEYLPKVISRQAGDALPGIPANPQVGTTDLEIHFGKWSGIPVTGLFQPSGRAHFTSIIPALRLALSSSVWMSLKASKIPGSFDFSIVA